MSRHYLWAFVLAIVYGIAAIRCDEIIAFEELVHPDIVSINQFGTVGNDPVGFQ